MTTEPPAPRLKPVIAQARPKRSQAPICSLAPKRRRHLPRRPMRHGAARANSNGTPSMSKEGNLLVSPPKTGFARLELVFALGETPQAFRLSFGGGGPDANETSHDAWRGHAAMPSHARCSQPPKRRPYPSRGPWRPRGPKEPIQQTQSLGAVAPSPQSHPGAAGVLRAARVRPERCPSTLGGERHAEASCGSKTSRASSNGHRPPLLRCRQPKQGFSAAAGGRRNDHGYLPAVPATSSTVRPFR